MPVLPVRHFSKQDCGVVGLYNKSVAPSIMLFSSSISVLLLVTNTIWTYEKVRIFEHISKPLFPGNFISKITKCGLNAFIFWIVYENSVTAKTSYPFPDKRVFRCACMVKSSSTISIFFIKIPPWHPIILYQREFLNPYCRIAME